MRTLSEAMIEAGPLTRPQIRERCGLNDRQMEALRDHQIGVGAIILKNDVPVSHVELLVMARDAAERLDGELVETGYRWESIPPDAGMYWFAVSRPR